MNPLLSLLRRRRSILVFAFAVAAVSGVATPSLRARFSETILGQPPVATLHQPEILDPAALKTTNGQSDNSSSKRPGITGMGTAGLVAGGIQGRLASSRAQLKLDSLDDVDQSASHDVPALDTKDAAALMAVGTSGLQGVPSPIGGRTHGGGFGNGAGMPGGFSSGLRSDFNHGLPADEHKTVAENSKANSTSTASSSTTVVVVTSSPKFDPNRPFGKSDLTKLDTKETDDLNDNQQVAAAPLATPEPGTLLLVANGVAAAFGSRFLRRRRRER